MPDAFRTYPCLMQSHAAVIASRTTGTDFPRCKTFSVELVGLISRVSESQPSAHGADRVRDPLRRTLRDGGAVSSGTVIFASPRRWPAAPPGARRHSAHGAGSHRDLSTGTLQLNKSADRLRFSRRWPTHVISDTPLLGRTVAHGRLTVSVHSPRICRAPGSVAAPTQRVGVRKSIMVVTTVVTDSPHTANNLYFQHLT